MRRTAFLAGLTVLALLTSCLEREEEEVLVLEEEAPDTVVVAPYWEEEEPLTIEDIERGRLDSSWREAPSIDSLLATLMEPDTTSLAPGGAERPTAGPPAAPESLDVAVELPAGAD